MNLPKINFNLAVRLRCLAGCVVLAFLASCDNGEYRNFRTEGTKAEPVIKTKSLGVSPQVIRGSIYGDLKVPEVDQGLGLTDTLTLKIGEFELSSPFKTFGSANAMKVSPKGDSFTVGSFSLQLGRGLIVEVLASGNVIASGILVASEQSSCAQPQYNVDEGSECAAMTVGPIGSIVAALFREIISSKSELASAAKTGIFPWIVLFEIAELLVVDSQTISPETIKLIASNMTGPLLEMVRSIKSESPASNALSLKMQAIFEAKGMKEITSGAVTWKDAVAAASDSMEEQAKLAGAKLTRTERQGPLIAALENIAQKLSAAGKGRIDEWREQLSKKNQQNGQAGLGTNEKELLDRTTGSTLANGSANGSSGGTAANGTGASTQQRVGSDATAMPGNSGGTGTAGTNGSVRSGPANPQGAIDYGYPSEMGSNMANQNMGSPPTNGNGTSTVAPPNQPHSNTGATTVGATAPTGAGSLNPASNPHTGASAAGAGTTTRYEDPYGDYDSDYYDGIDNPSTTEDYQYSYDEEYMQ